MILPVQTLRKPFVQVILMPLFLSTQPMARFIPDQDNTETHRQTSRPWDLVVLPLSTTLLTNTTRLASRLEQQPRQVELAL